MALHLLFVIKGLVVRGGGAERVFVDVANALHARGHRIEIATFDAAGPDFFYPLAAGIPVHRLAAGQPGVPTPRMAMIGLLARMRALVRQTKPDAVVAFMHSTYVPVGIALAGSGVPLVASEHVNAAHFVQRPLQRALRALVSALARATTVPTAAIRAEYPERGRARVVTISNPIALDHFATGRGRAPASPPVILGVGRLMEEKDFPTLIVAFEQVAADFPAWRLRIVGDGILRGALEARIAASAVGDRIALPGVSTDMASEYADAAFVAVPSLYESFGLVTAEALASARPVVGFADCVGTADLIADGANGLLIDPGADRAAALAAGLRRLMTDQALRDRLAAAGPASVERFAPEAIVDRWERLLEAVVAGRDPASLGNA